MLKAIVIAGYYDQYAQWLKHEERQPSEYRYVDSQEQLQGLHDVPIIRIGSWTRNPVALHPIIWNRTKTL